MPDRSEYRVKIAKAAKGYAELEIYRGDKLINLGSVATTDVVSYADFEKDEIHYVERWVPPYGVRP